MTHNMRAGDPALNPFRYGKPVPPERFIGREEALRTLFARINNGESTAVVGTPHIGKSSFLRYIGAETVRANWLRHAVAEHAFIDIDCHLLPMSYRPGDFWEHVLGEIERLFPERTVAAQVVVVRQSGWSAFALKRLFDTLSRMGKRAVVLVDEFDVLLYHANFNTPDFFGALRSLSTSTDGLALVSASRMSVAEMNRRSQELNPGGSPFFNTFTEARLMPLRPAEVELLIAQTLEGTGVSFSPEDRVYLNRMTGRHPFLVQLTAAAMFEAAVRGLRGPARYAEVFRTLQSLATPHYEDLWRHLRGPMQRAVLALALAEVQGAAGSLEQHETELRQLADGELIEPVDGGRYAVWRGERWRLTARSFALWVAAQASEEPARPAPEEPAALRRNVAQAFNGEELESLCADLAINYEDVAGETHETRVRELLAYCERRGMTAQLVARLRELRPHVAW
jgi:hypothetical protein